MIVPVTVQLQVKWMPTGNFLLWGVHPQNRRLLFHGPDLKHWLFAWHAPSYYGTLLDCLETDGIEGVLLPAEMALDYFSEPSVNPLLNFEYSDELKELLRITPYIRDIFDKEQLVPDFAKWREGKLGWKLPDAVCSFLPYLDEWLNVLLTERLEQDKPLETPWEKLAQSVSDKRLNELPADFWTDEQDWLITIGWKTDAAPFRTCLRLTEPAQDADADAEWKLTILLQDRIEDRQYVECDESGVALSLEVPNHWRPYLPEVPKDIRKCTYLIPWLGSDETRTRIRTSISLTEAWNFLQEGALRLMEFGYSVLLPAWWQDIRKAKPRLKAKIQSPSGTSATSLFGLDQIVQFDWKLAVGDIEMSEEQFWQAIESNRELIRIHGRWIRLDPEKLQEIRRRLQKIKRNNGIPLGEVLHMHLLGVDGDDEGLEKAAAEGEPIPEPITEAALNETLRQWLGMLQRNAPIPRIEPPASFCGTLRPYQVEGVSWLLFLRQYGLGGCLADDMGLGKTVQWITYLLSVIEREAPASPSLLVCPTSVIGNWQKELERFAPMLKVYVHYGPNRQKGDEFQLAASQADLIITSYALAYLDREQLRSVRWSSFCLDEAQNIKNAYTKQSLAVRSIHADHRIALTGTPMENRLTELWSIFDFINPGYLGSLRSFSRHFALPVEKYKDSRRAAQVKRWIQPFLLRREKRDPQIGLDLPDKQETKTYVSLTPEQAALYETVLDGLFASIERSAGMERRGMILATLTKLKQICNYPGLFLKETSSARWRGRSHKIERLLEMVRELREEGDKCLIFTQFAQMGGALAAILRSELAEPVQFLHGETPKVKRDEMVSNFQSPTCETDRDCGIFILSLKAGGAGLNLTAANHVFHFDRWWNPAVENQATDRAYRIGQYKHVLVYKFVTLGTLEERIDEMLGQKQGLTEQIVGENWITEFSDAELKDLFALRREWVTR